MDDTSQRIAENLRSIRTEKGLTQGEVAQKAGTNTNYYAKVERGEATASIPMLEKIADVLGVDISALFLLTDLRQGGSDTNKTSGVAS